MRNVLVWTAILIGIGCGADRAPTGDDDDAPPGETEPPAVYVAKVKNLLVGLAPTRDEVAAVEADPAALRGLIDGWMAHIRARMEFGKEMHRKLQSDRGCHEKELTLSSGRPDCIRFDPGDCKVIEFKPDTYSTSDAKDQAERYLRDVRERFKTDDRAKQCQQNSDGPIFKAVGETYAACRP